MEIAEGDNWNTATFPHSLGAVLKSLSYMEGWEFTLENLDRGQGCEGLTLTISIMTPNSYKRPKDHFRENLLVHHLFPVPAAAYDYRTWRRWVLDQILLVHQHEACEFFTEVCINCKGSRSQSWLDFPCAMCEGRGYTKPFAPHHEDGANPYVIDEEKPVR